MGAVTPLQLGTIFAAASTQITTHARHQILEEASELFQYSAQKAIGTYEFGWPQLAESTQVQRVSQGYSANEPLLRTGDLLGSITHNVDPMANQTGEAYVGTDNPYAKYQEFGTSRIPARPFLGGAIAQEEHRIPEIVHKALAKLFP
jgi:HK97 gp10 family phage protein